MATHKTGIFSLANQAFRNKNYERALELYLQCKKIYGDKVVSMNIKQCQAKIVEAIQVDRSPEAADITALNTDPEPRLAKITGPIILDPATSYLLARAGKLQLTNEQRELCLKQHKELTSRASENAEIKTVSSIPNDWPKDLILAPLPESTNDFLWHLSRKKLSPEKVSRSSFCLSIIIPTFNRTDILEITLACLANQDTNYPFEVIIADDGSQEPIESIARKYEAKLDIKYVRQKDYGYQLCAVRNLGLRTAKYNYLAILDCDMAPNTKWVESYMELLSEDDDTALIGPRKYVDTSIYTADDFLENPALVGELPEVLSPDTEGRSHVGNISKDWRLDHFRETEGLRLCDAPFRYFSGGNVAFARKWLTRAGWFDEEFTNWGGEDNEFGYRLYRAGCFFRSINGAMAYHQEPPGKENETDRAEGKKITNEIVREKVPYFYRKISPLASAILHEKPLVSIYIPAYNCENFIESCVDSALNQTIVDLEVCICNDGSTDNTLEILEEKYGGNPRVRIETQANRGIGSASNNAVQMTRGYYIGQLDSDDYLEPDAVELCLKEFLRDRKLACVYTTNRNVNPDGSLIANGYNWPIFSREKLTTAMIAHHFRMFTARAWNITKGFNESISNAVDYDMYLKLSEVGPFFHLNKVAYNRVIHGENTSIRKASQQKANHFRVVNNYLTRQGVINYTYFPNTQASSDKTYKFEPSRGKSC